MILKNKTKLLMTLLMIVKKKMIPKFIGWNTLTLTSEGLVLLKEFREETAQLKIFSRLSLSMDILHSTTVHRE